MRLAGRVALVTGSSRGIGAAIARKLASEGASVVLHARSDRARCESLAQTLRGNGVTAYVVTGDLSDNGTAEDVVRSAFSFEGKLDILVFNAGGGKGGMAIDQTSADIDRTIQLNLLSTIRGAAEFSRLTQSLSGRVIYISSGIATNAAPGASISAAAKAGSEAFIRCLAQELGPRGITCNSVAPGCTRTEMIAGQAWPDQVPPWTALGRLGEPEDIADIVAFLASDDARWLTGTTIPANGGLVTTAANILARSKSHR